MSLERLAGYRRAGVTRISLGVQSLDDRILPTLDRLHTAAQAREAFDAARAAGFEDVSVDLIYGLPGARPRRPGRRRVKGVARLGARSPLGATRYLDEGSLWHAAGQCHADVLPPEETIDSRSTRGSAELAAEAGFEHYEISNYARPGHRSAHNQIYWRAEEYLGLGPGACGFLGDVRYGNVKPVERYGAMVAAGEPPVGTHETLTPRQRMAERLILGLRLGDGVPGRVARRARGAGAGAAAGHARGVAGARAPRASATGACA